MAASGVSAPTKALAGNPGPVDVGPDGLPIAPWQRTFTREVRWGKCAFYCHSGDCWYCRARFLLELHPEWEVVPQHYDQTREWSWFVAREDPFRRKVRVHVLRQRAAVKHEQARRDRVARKRRRQQRALEASLHDAYARQIGP